MNSSKRLSGPSFLKHKNPKKLIILLHGYGDNGDNFIHLANSLDQFDLKANYIAFNAPFSVPNYSQGKQWFDLYPNGTYIADAGIEESKMIRAEILNALELLRNSIHFAKDKYNLLYKDCFLLGFSQGGMITYEFGNFLQDCMGGLAILSGRILKADQLINPYLKKTPIFISHGIKDEVLPVNDFYESCKFLKNNNFFYEEHLLLEDSHTISLKAINLLQKFIKKNL